MKHKVIIIISMLIAMYIFPIYTHAASPVATLTVDGAFYGNYPSVQDAVDAVTSVSGNDFIVEIADGTVSDPLNIKQRQNKNLTIRPQNELGVTFTNTIFIDGDDHFYYSEWIMIEGLSFVMTAGSPQDCIDLDFVYPPAGHCYPHNVTIDNCHFKGVRDYTVAIQSIAGGMHNIAITNCTADNMHSFAQLKAVAGYASIQNCILTNSLEGINFYGTADLVIESCQISADLYAVRSGQNGSGSVVDDGSVTINNSYLEASSPLGGVLILRLGTTKNINVLHSTLNATALNGNAIQNLNLNTATSYKILFSESDVIGGISGIDTSTITIIDDPNIPNGPVFPTPTPDYVSVLLLITILMVLEIVLTILIILFLSFCCKCPYKPDCPKHCHCKCICFRKCRR